MSRYLLSVQWDLMRICEYVPSFVSYLYPSPNTKPNKTISFNFRLFKMQLLLLFAITINIQTDTNWVRSKIMAEEDDSLVETSFENSIHFQNAWSTAGCVEDFLHREEYIGVRGTCLDDPEELIYEYDIDGITILWKNVANGLSLDFTHFDLASRGAVI